MEAKVTWDVLESYLNCRLKGYFKFTGQRGPKSDYENLRTEMRENVREAAIGKMVASHPRETISRNVPLTISALKQRASLLIDAALNDDFFSLTLDGLQKVDGPSKLGDFHYIPVLFNEGETVRKEQRSMLGLCGLLISRLQGLMPSHGIIWYGEQCRTTKVRLNADMRTTERLLRDVKELCGLESPPPLILNEHCKVCEFRQRCHDQAVQEDNISLIRSLGVKEIKSYARKGILTVTQLAHTFRPRRKPKRAAESSKKRYHALQALAIRDIRIYVFGMPETPTSPVTIYLDIESTSERRGVYLIGMIIVENGSESRHSLWADNSDQERQLFEQFLAIVGKYPGGQLFCYGAYERDFIKRMSKVVADQSIVESLLNRLTNVLSTIFSHVYFPTYSNGLKDIGRFLGCGWTDAESSGLQSIVWRHRWEATHSDEWKQKLLDYNLEDCVALKKVTDLLCVVASDSASGKGSLSLGEEAFPVSTVQEMDKLTYDRKWGPVNFFHPEYEYINNCARFDYQRDRVFVRTNPSLRKRRKQATQAGHRNRSLRASVKVRITSSHCPFCGGTDVEIARDPRSALTSRPRVKRAFDLVFTPSGIRRKVIECRSSLYQCLNCRQTYVPKEHDQLDKHFHGLKSWAMYQHITHRLSLVTIQDMIKDFFGLFVADAEIHMIKSLMASHYAETYRKLLAKILTGNLLHVDETEVKLRVGKGYVWVFTNLEEVVFLFKPNREGGFLKEMLKDFKGVVVSDFYAAYDSLDCPQQKCLIHLMRDMNQDLLNNPFDSELQSVTQPFGILLRDVVGTIDVHGLTRKHLQRHQRDISTFFEQLSEQSFRSEAAEALRGRLLKSREKLFTFINHDGVPWNNNYAENAIKRFAYYREGTVGTMKETGLSDYLVLLSICQTCRYKSVSFLKFLLSRVTDMDAFCEGNRANHRLPLVEVYPDGFSSPFFRCRKAAKTTMPSDSISETSKLDGENHPDENWPTVNLP